MINSPFHPRSLPDETSNSYPDEPPPPYTPPAASPPPPPQQQQQQQPLIPPPFYSPPTSNTPQPSLYSPPPRNTQPLIPPPFYSPPSAQVRSQLPLRLAPYQESLQLQKLLSRYRWKTYYGPKPRTLTHALRKASLWGDRPFVLSILATYAAEIWGSYHNTCVHEALRGPKPEIAFDILNWFERKSGDIKWVLNSQDKETGVTPLHVAAECGVEVWIVRKLVEMGAELDKQDLIGRTALLMGCRYRRTKVVKGLVEIGAEWMGIMRGDLWERWWEGSKEREMLGGLEGVRGVLKGVLREMGLDGWEEEEERESPRGEDEEELLVGWGGVEQRRGLGGTSEHTEIPREEEIVNVEGDLLAGWGGGVERHESGGGSGSRSSSGQEMTFAHDALLRSITEIMDGSRSQHERGVNWQFIQAAILASNLGEQDPLVRRIVHIQGRLENGNSGIHPGLLGTAEYEAWKADCEALLGEHRRQRERNRLAEVRGLERFGQRRG
ncbi:hypothetical protein QBC38DRAFT_196595 [Podospora fimiseda]|uniref:Ankyrin n=1 Tax=Podospora fimiseda TaxID=252190 RepID=A0AAN7BQM6_9PEZI|nr:hypothetical protein QBC38DRAFT_196595 [Podospora fimiseda]